MSKKYFFCQSKSILFIFLAMFAHVGLKLASIEPLQLILFEEGPGGDREQGQKSRGDQDDENRELELLLLPSDDVADYLACYSRVKQKIFSTYGRKDLSVEGEVFDAVLSDKVHLLEHASKCVGIAFLVVGVLNLVLFLLG